MDNSKHKKIKRRFTFPNAFVVIGIIMILFIIFSWIGEAAKISFTGGSIVGLGILDVFPAVWKGFTGKADIILFIFALGGLLGVMGRSKILDAGVNSLVKVMNGKEIFIIPILMLLFGLGGSTYGMWEETLAFLPIVIPVFIKARYGALTGVFTVLLGAGTGVIASTINPFAIGVGIDAGQSINGVTMGGNLGWRWLIWIAFMIPVISFVMWYAWRNRKTNMAKSYLTPRNFKDMAKKFVKTEDIPHFSTRMKVSFAIFSMAFVIMILFYLPWGTFLASDDLSSFNDKFKEIFFWFGSTNGGWAALGDWYFISVASIFLMTTLIIFLINIRDYRKKTVEVVQPEVISSHVETSSSQDKVVKATDTIKLGKIDQLFSNIRVLLGKTIRRDVFISKKQELIKQEQTTDIVEEESKPIADAYLDTYFEGVKWMISVSLLIAFAGGLGNILTASNIGPWIAHSAEGLKDMHLIGFALIMFFLCLVLSILVPSTSGFVTAFFPIFVAIVSRFDDPVVAFNIVLLTFILANGIANFFTPTSAVLMGYTNYALISYKTWIKATWKVILGLIILSIIVLIISALVLPISMF